MIFTDSAFYFGTEITDDNRLIRFIEDGLPLIAELTPGKYSLTDLAREASRAMNVVGDQDYRVSINRSTRIATIEAELVGATDFTLSLSETSASAFSLLGFTGSDLTGNTEYSGTAKVGLEYRPQFRLQGFVDFDDNQKAVESSVLTSASGRVETVRFGIYKLMEAEIKFITDIDQGVGGYIRTNNSGVADARRFMEYAVTKGDMEFIPDAKSPAVFTKCILESTPESSEGVDFKLKEEFAQGLTGYYTTGLLVFREVR
jgi:hypothetical protein